MNYEVVVFTCLTLSSMIGAGVLATPKAVLPFGFAATVGWVLASVCSLILSRIFAEIALSPKIDSSSGIPGIIKSGYGSQQAFIIGFGQWMYLCFGGSAVTLLYTKYLCDLVNISGNFLEFFMSVGILLFFTILYYFSTAAMGILSLLTVVKIVLFGTTAILGITDFNFNNFFGIPKGFFAETPGIFSAFKYAFTHLNGKAMTLSEFMSYVFKSCSIALFAFGGMESAMSSSSSIKDPKNTIPKATVIAVVACSAIFILTHICTVNALGDLPASSLPEAPVKVAAEILIGNHFGQYIGFIAGKIISILVILGCLGSVMALCFIPPNCLYDTLSIASSSIRKRFPKSTTGFSLEAGLASISIMTLIIFFYYFISSNVSSIIQYSVSLLISSYLQCVFVHLKQRDNLPLSFLGLAVCLFFLYGCSLQAIVFGLIVSYFSNTVFILLSTAKSNDQESDKQKGIRGAKGEYQNMQNDDPEGFCVDEFREDKFGCRDKCGKDRLIEQKSSENDEEA